MASEICREQTISCLNPAEYVIKPLEHRQRMRFRTHCISISSFRFYGTRKRKFCAISQAHHTNALRSAQEILVYIGKENAGKIMRTPPFRSVTTPDVNIGFVKAQIDDEQNLYGVLGIYIPLAGFDLSRRASTLTRKSPFI